MTKFNLEALPLCGAKTRSGLPCKRRGNKKNGKCKLHGGRSTGAKTELGKIVVARNAHKEFPHDVINPILDEKHIQQSLNTYVKLEALMSKTTLDWSSIFNLIEHNKISLEAAKYFLLRQISTDAFLLIQTALDSYYQEVGEHHLSFHAYTPMFMPYGFSREMTAEKQKRINKWAKGYVLAWEKPLPWE
ncbi:hypothetical protein A6E13_18860 [Aliivibrio fischeri]|uniref:HGGxSTG domain-containing protein n=1 Tax=Aliivibrio fischeri TaxID=668 RepID=UPI00080DF6CC|nr:HGGxSTG domain-containing protein [Aliivibrio fischeri]OCH25792.1 hypothetical protein A6E12_02275 [Aliivibrio fischeri]OCH30696.1 hypothetical protein A6E13_18860 [Aliivibrio fischeri]